VLQHAKWRVTPHGIAIVCGWFGLTKEESVRITSLRALRVATGLSMGGICRFRL